MKSMKTPNPTATNSHLMKIVLATALTVLLASCSSNDSTPVAGESTDPDNDSTPTTQPRIAFAMKETGGTEPEYLIAQDDIMTTDLSAQGAGLEQLGWNFFYPVGNTVFITGYENFETQSFTVDENGDLSRLNTFLFDQPLEMFGAIGDDTFLATDTPRDGTHTVRELYIVDANTGLITRRVNYQIDDVDTGTPGEGTVGWPTALTVRGDQLFIPFHKLDDSGAFQTPNPDTAWVAVYDWPLADDATPVKIISDERTSFIGANGFATSLIVDTSGDIYSYSTGSLSAGFDPASTKPSGILRIPAGQDDFDTDYFLDIEAATEGAKLFWFDSLGNGKALGRLITSEENASFYSAYSKDNYNQKLVFIDLDTQTVTDIDGIPLHQKRYTSPMTIIDGFVYESIETADGSFVYRIDAATGEATRGGEILGKTVKGFFSLD